MKLKLIAFLLVALCKGAFGQLNPDSVFRIKPTIRFDFSSKITPFSFSEPVKFEMPQPEIKLKLQKLYNKDEVYYDLNGKAHKGIKNWGDFLQSIELKDALESYSKYH